jgi:hypothetical protein
MDENKPKVFKADASDFGVTSTSEPNTSLSNSKENATTFGLKTSPIQPQEVSQKKSIESPLLSEIDKSPEHLKPLQNSASGRYSSINDKCDNEVPRTTNSNNVNSVEPPNQSAQQTTAIMSPTSPRNQYHSPRLWFRSRSRPEHPTQSPQNHSVQSKALDLRESDARNTLLIFGIARHHSEHTVLSLLTKTLVKEYHIFPVEISRFVRREDIWRLVLNNEEEVKFMLDKKFMFLNHMLHFELPPNSIHSIPSASKEDTNLSASQSATLSSTPHSATATEVFQFSSPLQPSTTPIEPRQHITSPISSSRSPNSMVSTTSKQSPSSLSSVISTSSQPQSKRQSYSIVYGCYCSDPTPTPPCPQNNGRYLSDVRCNYCNHFFHQRCLSINISYEVLPGDWLYEFVCAQCYKNYFVENEETEVSYEDNNNSKRESSLTSPTLSNTNSPLGTNQNKLQELFRPLFREWDDILCIAFYVLNLEATRGLRKVKKLPIHRNMNDPSNGSGDKKSAVVYYHLSDLLAFLDEHWMSLCYRKHKKTTHEESHIQKILIQAREKHPNRFKNLQLDGLSHEKFGANVDTDSDLEKWWGLSTYENPLLFVPPKNQNQVCANVKKRKRDADAANGGREYYNGDDSLDGSSLNGDFSHTKKHVLKLKKLLPVYRKSNDSDDDTSDSGSSSETIPAATVGTHQTETTKEKTSTTTDAKTQSKEGKKMKRDAKSKKEKGEFTDITKEDIQNILGARQIDGKLHLYVQWSNEKLKRERQRHKQFKPYAFIPSSVLREKAPEKVIEFYEQRLSFRSPNSQQQQQQPLPSRQQTPTLTQTQNQNQTQNQSQQQFQQSTSTHREWQNDQSSQTPPQLASQVSSPVLPVLTNPTPFSVFQYPTSLTPALVATLQNVSVDQPNHNALLWLYALWCQQLTAFSNQFQILQQITRQFLPQSSPILQNPCLSQLFSSSRSSEISSSTETLPSQTKSGEGERK